MALEGGFESSGSLHCFCAVRSAIVDSALSSAEAHVLAEVRDWECQGGALLVPHSTAEMQKVASMASTLVLFFTQAVLMFGL